MHHHKTQVSILSKIGIVARSVKTMHTNLFAKSGKLHKFATANSNSLKSNSFKHASS